MFKLWEEMVGFGGGHIQSDHQRWIPLLHVRSVRGVLGRISETEGGNVPRAVRMQRCVSKYRYASILCIHLAPRLRIILIFEKNFKLYNLIQF